MVHCYRLCSGKYSASDATGAFIAGGRWNRKGTYVLYTSGSLSLACLEILVHIREPRLPTDYVWSQIEVPEELIGKPDLSQVIIADEQACAQFGSSWVHKGETPALQVPSVIIPNEFNLLITPKHADFSSIVFRPPRPFQFDARLLKTTTGEFERFYTEGKTK
ncbi:MAG: RES family NAD+ phosphorylase [Acidobacteriaceae bacterium]|nr:RES family NAD+ phosphorylase [Acidobacteriaceae bacterium]